MIYQSFARAFEMPFIPLTRYLLKFYFVVWQGNTFRFRCHRALEPLSILLLTLQASLGNYFRHAFNEDGK